MKILNFGSLNLDYVYSVDHMVAPGETLASSAMNVYCGGKGLNQSVALAKAGALVYHAGMVGGDGGILLDMCRQNGVDAGYIRTVPQKTGHTIIQVDKNGQNSILLYGGANRCITVQYVDEVLTNFEKGDILLLQNEINLLDYMIDRAYEKGMMIVLNPSPYNSALDSCDFEKVSVFLLNEIEGAQISGEKESERILEKLKAVYPKAKVVLTLGSEGAVYQDGEMRLHQGIYEVDAVDTTAAGDTFTGYFIASIAAGMDAAEGLKLAAKASAIAVTRPGAVPSIPAKEEVWKAKLTERV